MSDAFSEHVKMDPTSCIYEQNENLVVLHKVQSGIIY